MINKKFAAGLLSINLLISSSVVFAGSNYSYQPTQTQPVYNSGYYQKPLEYNNYNVQNNTLQGNVIMVPAGTSMSAVLTTPVSSAASTVGQSVNMLLGSDFYYNNRLVAPAGSTIYGTVIEASKAKHGSMNGKLSVRFTQIYTPNGSQIPISAVIKTDDGTGVLVGGTKLDVTKDYAKDLAVGSATGALSGLVFGALAGGNIGRGAALGTAVGAGGGLVKSVIDKGDDVEIPANAAVDIVLTQPITVSTSSYYYEN